MTEQITDERLGHLLAHAASEEDIAILGELKERRRQATYTRKQRLDFMLRIVKDTMPEIARELREIYNEQDNALYYARRDSEFWKREADARPVDRRGLDRPSSGSLEGND